MSVTLGPTLTTKRLTLRPPQLSDYEPFNAFAKSDRSKFVGGPIEEISQSWRTFAGVTGHWALRGFGLFVMVDKSSERPVGICGPYYPIHWPERELGWSIWSPAFEGQGLIQEAALCIRDHVYGDLGWSTLVSYIDPNNKRSIATAKKLGCRLDRTARRPDPEDLVYRHPKPEARP
ncbi:MAG: GNAT family N-acetyltransferase [Pseudomonadota bacterium]